jgi:DNA polymerase-3 subunit gamma/tau
MSSYVVSARKYRPMSFDTVVGQEHITRTLINEIKSQKLAQAFLFCGPRGVGKTTCARILSKEINKEEGKDTPSDFAFNIFEMDAASNNSVDDIRNLVDQVRIPPQTGKYKVYIIDEVHMLSSSAFNAFLKTLEEPPPYAIFILATTERHKILPTILSRCQVFNFERITVKSMVEHLQSICQKEEIKAEVEALHLIAQKADGAMRDALSIFDQMVSFSDTRTLVYSEILENLNILDYDYYFGLTEGFLDNNSAKALLVFDEIQKKGFDGQLFLSGLASHFRDLLVCKSPDTLNLLEVPGNIAEKYRAQAKAVPDAFLLNALNVVDKYDQSYKTSNNQRLHVELALIKLSHLQQAINLLEEVKKKSLSQ